MSTEQSTTEPALTELKNKLEEGLVSLRETCTKYVEVLESDARLVKDNNIKNENQDAYLDRVWDNVEKLHDALVQLDLTLIRQRSYRTASRIQAEQWEGDEIEFEKHIKKKNEELKQKLEKLKKDRVEAVERLRDWLVKNCGRDVVEKVMKAVV